MGAMPTACQPIVPSRPAQTMFSPGIWLYRHASRKASQFAA